MNSATGLSKLQAPTVSRQQDTAVAPKADAHEFGCTAYVGRPCICATLRLERARSLPHAPHTTPVPACLDCEDALADARADAADLPEAG